MGGTVETNDRAPELPEEARELMERWDKTLRMLERIVAECMRVLGAKPQRRSVGDVMGDPAKEPKKRITEPALERMWSRRQISDRNYLAGKAVDVLLSQIAALDGLGSTLKSEGMLSGGGAGDAPTLARLQVAQRWAALQSEILADNRCGSDVEHRRHAIKVLELVCHHGLGIGDIEKLGGMGRRAVLARRLKAALDVAAGFFRVRGAEEGRVRVVHFDAVDVETGEMA